MNKKLLCKLMGCALCVSVVAAGIGCGSDGTEGSSGCGSDNSQSVVKYEGDMLYNGFDSVADLYRVEQKYTWGFNPVNGKLEIVNKDNFMPVDEDAEDTENQDYQAVITQIDALPELSALTFADKDAVAKARVEYGKLTEENRAKITNISKLEALENSDVLKGYYTLGDFDGRFDESITGVAGWDGFSGNLVDEMSGTVIFKASNLSTNDGALYIDLFHDDSINAGQSGDGIYMMLRPYNNTVLFANSTGSAINFKEGETISPDETYTFYVTYKVADDYSKLDVSLVIKDSAGYEILNGSQEITEFELSDFGSQTIKSWLVDHKNANSHKTFYINSGSSKGASLINAWTPTSSTDFALEKDPHDEADLSPRQGDGALRIYYGGGAITDILARFDDSILDGLPVAEIGSFSVKVYNDSAEEKTVTLSLMQKDDVKLNVEGGAFTLAPYAWTECKVTLEPVVAEYFQNELIGLNITFKDVTESVYYLDDFRIQFGPVHTEATKAWTAKADDLQTKISTLVGKTITASDKAIIEELCVAYSELPQSYRYIVKNVSVLEQAVTDYISITSAQQIEEEGRETVLHFNSPISIMQVGESTVATAAYTTEDSAPGETGGSMKITFDGTDKWSRVALSPSKSTQYEEIHLWVNNLSEYKRAIYLDWQLVSQAFDADGKEISLAGGYTLPANSGWIKLVYTAQFPLTQINSVSLTDGGSAINSVDALLVGKVDFVYKYEGVEELISALPEYYAGYSDEDKAAVVTAREAYDKLSFTSKLKITNVSKLVNIEASVWKEGFSAISVSSPDALTVYNMQDKTAVEELRKSYENLDSEVKNILVTEEATLTAFEVKLEQLQEAFVDRLEQQIASLTSANPTAVAEARAAYDSLSDENKAKVENANVLFALEATIWRSQLAALPAESEINDYDADLDNKITEVRDAYNALADEVKALVETDEARLTALEARLARFGEIVLEPGEIKVTTTESNKWHVENITPTKESGYDQAIVVLRNDSEYKTVFQATWNIASAAYDENGNPVSLVGGYVIPANSGWLTLVFDSNFSWTELDMVLFNESNDAISGDINMTIASITFIYKAPVVEAMIDALDGTDANAIKEARAAYDALSSASKANVANLDKLIGHEADLWKEGMVGLPASPDDITVYDVNVNKQVEELLASYEQLSPAMQSKLTAEKALLDSLKEKLLSLQDSLLVVVKAQIAALDGTDATAIAEARTAYDSLLDSYKMQVDNRDILFGYEADIWKAMLVGLPEASEITKYDVALATKLRMVRNAYDALADEVKAIVTTEADTLSALEEKLAEYGEIVATPGNIVGSGDSCYNVATGVSSTSSFEEAHVLLRNNGSDDVYFYVDWNTCAKTYNENGEEITNLTGGYVLPGNSGWITIVYMPEGTNPNAPLVWNEFNVAVNGWAVGNVDVTVDSITFVYETTTGSTTTPSGNTVVATPGNITDTGSTWYYPSIGWTSTTGAGEVQVKIKNNGANNIAFYITSSWTTCTSAYDANGAVVTNHGYLVSADGEWYTLVYSDISAIDVLVIGNLGTGGAIAGDIDVTIESITLVQETETSTNTVVATPGNITDTGSTWYYPSIGWTSTTGAGEVQVKIKNNGANNIAFYITSSWTTCTSAYDANGAAVTNHGYVVSADGEWYTLVYSDISAIDVLVIGNLNSSGGAIAGDIDVTIESITLVQEPVESDEPITLSDLGGTFTGNDTGLSAWSVRSGNLVDATKGTIVFKVSGLTAAAGALYVSLFQDPSVNPGQAQDGIAFYLTANGSVYFFNSTSSDKTISSTATSLSSSETYTISVTYELASDYSKITISVVIKDSTGAEIVNGSKDITSVSLTDFGTKTIKEWIVDHANASTHQTFFISTGASSDVSLLDAD